MHPLVIALVCLMNVSLGPKDTITTINGEVLQTRILKANNTGFTLEDFEYHGRTIHSLDYDYISTIRFADGFHVSFIDGVLNRDGLLGTNIVKGEQKYRAKGLFALTEEEMCVYIGTDNYYHKWRPFQKKLELGTWQIGVGISLFSLGLLLSNQYHYYIPYSVDGPLDDITACLHFSGSGIPLAICNSAMTTFFYGIGETAYSLHEIKRFNNGKETKSLTTQQASTWMKMGTGFAIAGMIGTLVGTIVWCESFNPNVEYSLFGGYEYTGYYTKDRHIIYTNEDYTIGKQKRSPDSYLGPWAVFCGTLLTNLGLAIALPAREVLKSDIEMSLGATPGGYGLLVKW